MKLNRVLVTFKKPSRLRTASAKGENLKLKHSSPALFRQSIAQQKSHLTTIEQVEKTLKKLKIPYKVIPREKLEKPHPLPWVRKFRERMIKADLLVTIGGDGSVLAASHVAGNIPILGVNSLPETSVGFFCDANAKYFEKYLKKILAGTYKPVSLPLLEASINGEKIPYPALNDILFAGASPAETVQYTIQVGKKKECQRGSGVWMAAGPGSTAGIQSAGGKVLPVTSNELQFYARELCTIPGVRNKLKKGFAPKGEINITSEMSQGRAFLDGTKFIYPVSRGSKLKVKVSSRHLKLFLRK